MLLKINILLFTLSFFIIESCLAIKSNDPENYAKELCIQFPEKCINIIDSLIEIESSDSKRQKLIIKKAQSLADLWSIRLAKLLLQSSNVQDWELENEVKSLLLLSKIYEAEGKKDSALFYLEYLANHTNLQDNNVLKLDVYNALGIFFSKGEKYDKSRRYFDECLKGYIIEKDTKMIVNSYNHLSTIQYHKEQYDSAIFIGKMVLNKFKNLDMKVNSKVLSNLGAYYCGKGDYPEAFSYTREVLQYRIKTNDKRGIAGSYNNIGVIFENKKESDSAFYYYQIAADIADSAGYLKYSSEIVKGMAGHAFEVELYEKSANFYEKYVLLNDSLKKNTDRKNLAKYEALLESKAKENIILTQDKQIQDTSYNKKIWTGIAIFSFILGAIFVLFFWQRQRFYSKSAQQEKKLKEKEFELNQQRVNDLLEKQELETIHAHMNGQEEERKRIAKDLHDRLGSTLSTVKIYYGGIEENLPGDQKEKFVKAQKLLDYSIEEVRSVAHNLVSGTLSNFGLNAALKDLARILQESGKMNVEFDSHKWEEKLSSTEELALFRVTQELLSNVLKHANAKNIVLQLMQHENEVVMVVEDDGIGFNTLTVQKSGMGMQSIRSRIDGIGGTVKFDSRENRGTSVIISVPLKENIEL